LSVKRHLPKAFIELGGNTTIKNVAIGPISSGESALSHLLNLPKARAPSNLANLPIRLGNSTTHTSCTGLCLTGLVKTAKFAVAFGVFLLLGSPGEAQEANRNLQLPEWKPGIFESPAPRSNLQQAEQVEGSRHR
jgi:hypothetical protein